jgi:hypothetical protein
MASLIQNTTAIDAEKNILTWIYLYTGKSPNDSPHIAQNRRKF